MIAQLVAQAKRVKDIHVLDLLSKRNVVGVGLGYKVSEGISTGELSLLVSVTHKADISALAAEDLVPKLLGGVKTDVIETGKFRALDADPRGSGDLSSPRASL